MSTVHVAPIGDLIDHHIPGGWDGHGTDHDCGDCRPGAWLTLEALDGDDMECPCGPSVEVVLNPDGPDGHLITHHSLDGREQHEEAHP